ncbi:MAG: transposase [Boseongicola sp. SB0664_bin_43]|uniref:Transposase n=1 Tax=Boseongicola sp. SB0664_bin_43 TaxID=2604844 RepID=A0A6B0XXS2_9RHOB|nr:transposase [Boseongicola sp. SB0664_bin_43]
MSSRSTVSNVLDLIQEEPFQRLPGRSATCRGRNFVENFFGKFKEFRRVAKRCDKTARNCLSAMHLALSRVPLRRIASQLIGPTAQFAVRAMDLPWFGAPVRRPA